MDLYMVSINPSITETIGWRAVDISYSDYSVVKNILEYLALGINPFLIPCCNPRVPPLTDVSLGEYYVYQQPSEYPSKGKITDKLPMTVIPLKIKDLTVLFNPNYWGLNKSIYLINLN